MQPTIRTSKKPVQSSLCLCMRGVRPRRSLYLGRSERLEILTLRGLLEHLTAKRVAGPNHLKNDFFEFLLVTVLTLCSDKTCKKAADDNIGEYW